VPRIFDPENYEAAAAFRAPGPVRQKAARTIVLGIIGSIIGGAVTHTFSRPTNERYHPAGLIFSTLGAILLLFICFKLKIHFPQVNPF
jgi:uncharacterized membrane protein YeaQ/YmgE (transglycosylase-associated protein family)